MERDAVRRPRPRKLARTAGSKESKHSWCLSHKTSTTFAALRGTKGWTGSSRNSHPWKQMVRSSEDQHPQPEDHRPPQHSHRTDQPQLHHQAAHHGPGRERANGKAHGRHDSSGGWVRAQSRSEAGDADHLLLGKWEQKVDEQILTKKMGNGLGGRLTRFESTQSRLVSRCICQYYPALVSVGGG